MKKNILCVMSALKVGVMIEIFEIFWSAPIELRVIILGGLISPFILLRKGVNKDEHIKKI